MLTKYKPSHKKIAMGLLSYSPEQKDVKTLQETMQRYEEDDAWRLYLWKEEDMVAVAGLYMPEEGRVELRHLCVNPSFRDEGIAKKLVETLEERLQVKLHGTEETAPYLAQRQTKDEEQSGKAPSE
ncbi:riboflavin biosynthesis RibT protein [Salsuginibacillus halophilus]|uniref:Riboflavin biosynthesis RibT protein n=1 Tax=Salsuginibacillus halophilus TaxID=517424 RepID=A0A2P8HW43_9BACI|nr:GNAT family N-acetyltransferase [Salsuginibacillus halophilus]PSL50398.1 riboflavin biosynthesis RibT protein [Salsuginibacillus halophilus]